jgi:hypothetical protein
VVSAVAVTARTRSRFSPFAPRPGPHRGPSDIQTQAKLRRTRDPRLQASERGQLRAEMAATHLKWDPIPARHATGLPVKVTVQACTAQGERVFIFARPAPPMRPPAATLRGRVQTPRVVAPSRTSLARRCARVVAARTTRTLGRSARSRCSVRRLSWSRARGRLVHQCCPRQPGFRRAAVEVCHSSLHTALRSGVRADGNARRAC